MYAVIVTGGKQYRVSQGDTRDEVIANIREAIEVYLEDCQEVGDPIPTEEGREYVDLEVRVSP